MNAYEQLEGESLGRVERVSLLDVAHTVIERACGYVGKALEGMKDGDKGYEGMEQAAHSLNNARVWLEIAMRELEK